MRALPCSPIGSPPAASPMLRDLVDAVRRHQPFWIEVVSGCILVLWALVSMFGPDPLDRWPTMKIATELIPEAVWNWGALFFGTCQLLGLLSDNRITRCAAAGAACGFWGVLTITVQIAVPWAPANVLYFGYWVGNLGPVFLLLRERT